MTEPITHTHKILTPPLYMAIAAVLLLCTGANIGLSFLNMGFFNVVVALAIACFEAVLIVLFFMHVKYSSNLTKLTVGAGLFTFLVLITMTMSDYVSRAWGRW